MTRRSGEWHLLDLDGDPVPADRWDVEYVADEMSDRSREAGLMRDLLGQLSSLDGWRGQAAETFADKADDVLEDLGKVEDRYDAAASALSRWADDVDTARTATKRALDRAEAADTERRKYPEPSPGEDDPDQVKREDADDELNAARGALESAMDALDDAARRAESSINDAADIWDDGFWGNVKGWVRDQAELIDVLCKVLEVVAAVLGAIILVAAIVASAPFALIAAAVVAGVLLLAGHSMLAAADTGKADWGDVALDAAGLALTLVGGKAAASAMKGLKGLVPVMSARVGSEAEAAALTRLLGGDRTQYLNALKIANPSNNLARWATGLKGAAGAEGRTAAQQVDDLLTLNPGTLKSIAVQDRRLARMHSMLGELRELGPVADEGEAISAIAWRVNTAIGATVTETAIYGSGLPDTFSDATTMIQNPPWSTQPVG